MLRLNFDKADCLALGNVFGSKLKFLAVGFIGHSVDTVFLQQIG